MQVTGGLKSSGGGKKHGGNVSFNIGTNYGDSALLRKSDSVGLHIICVCVVLIVVKKRNANCSILKKRNK
jgi:hypothetical protein